MTVIPVTPISPERLRRMRWRSERAYQLLSYTFRLRSNRESIAERVDDVLGDFGIASTESQDAEIYRLIDLGPEEPRRYRLLREDAQLIGSPKLSDVVHQVMWHAMLGMAKQTKDLILIHAGAVATPDGTGVLFPASTGSGKTTLVTALVRAGFGFLSDEVGVVEPGTVRLHPFPRSLNLKEGSFALFPELHIEGDGSAVDRKYIRAGHVRKGSESGPCELGFVVALKYRPEARTEITALTSAELMKVLWANAMNLPGLGGRALPLLAGMIRRAKGYQLISSDLKGAVESVMDLVGVSSDTLPVVPD